MPSDFVDPIQRDLYGAMLCAESRWTWTAIKSSKMRPSQEKFQCVNFMKNFQPELKPLRPFWSIERLRDIKIQASHLVISFPEEYQFRCLSRKILKKMQGWWIVVWREDWKTQRQMTDWRASPKSSEFGVQMTTRSGATSAITPS